jgi:hypothetical protein
MRCGKYHGKGHHGKVAADPALTVADEDLSDRLQREFIIRNSYSKAALIDSSRAGEEEEGVCWPIRPSESL